MRPGYAAFLATAIATHALLGYAIGKVLFDSPVAGAAGGVVADVDFLFPAAAGWPFVHRGLTHSLLIAVLATGAVTIARGIAVGTIDVPGRRFDVDPRSPVSGAFGAAYLSHLLIDWTTPEGVPLLYPITGNGFHLGLPIGAHAPLPTLLVWIGCLAALYREGVVTFLPDGVLPVRGE